MGLGDGRWLRARQIDDPANQQGVLSPPWEIGCGPTLNPRAVLERLISITTEVRNVGSSHLTREGSNSAKVMKSRWGSTKSCRQLPVPRHRLGSSGDV
jgi:hypothetical protein